MVEERSPLPLDDAIDSVVKEMTNAEPLPGFDRRVRMRLIQPARPSFAWTRLAMGTAAVATIVVLALAFREDRPAPVATPDAPAIAIARTSPDPEPPPARTGTPARQSSAASRRQRPRAQLDRTVSAAAVDSDPLEAEPIPGIAPLDAPRELTVASIQQPAIAVPDIRMPAIEIRQLNLEALPAAGEGRKE